MSLNVALNETSNVASMNREDLVVEARGYAQALVRRMIKTMHLPTELEDELLAAAYMGLVEAAQTFDFDRGTDFRGYSYLRIRGAVIDSIQEASSLSRNSYWYSKALEATQELRETNETPETLAATRKATTEEVLARVLDYASSGALAFRLTFDEVEIEATEVASRSLNPEDKFEIREDFSILRKIVETLPEKERRVVEDYYFKDKSFSEIVDENEEMSKSWVSRLHSRAIDLVKRRYFEELRKQAAEAA